MDAAMDIIKGLDLKVKQLEEELKLAKVKMANQESTIVTNEDGAR